MTTKLIAGSALTGLVLATGFGGMVSAQSVADATGLTEEEVIEIALMEVPGEVLEVEQETYRGVAVFEVEVLGEDDIEAEIMIAGDTGEVLEISMEDDDCDHDDDDDDDDEDGEDDADEDEDEDGEDA